jgi:long-subunit acyl-CoA synthetase (AMP-forming)
VGGDHSDGVSLMTSGGMSVHPKVQKLICAVLSRPLTMGYHLIESTGHGLSSNLQDLTFKAYVGGPGSSMELKLRSCPEFDFDVDARDLSGGKVTKGELLLRGVGISPGFYNT